LAEDLLTLTRSEAGVLEPVLMQVDLAERVHATVSRLSREAREKGVEILGPATTPVPARVDPDLLDQVVWNLVGNAVKFSPAGGEVQVSLESGSDGVALTISDSGPGIPEEHVERVFERFFRIDESRTHVGDATGTGLGLAIARAIVEMHGGEIEAGNRSGGGAVFTVSLP
jgi:two-component system sensor histidine kinase BaeS